MKKVFAFVLTLTVSFALLGCNKQPDAGGVDSKADDTGGVGSLFGSLTISADSTLDSLQKETGIVFSAEQATAFYWLLDKGQVLVEGKRLKAKELVLADDTSASIFEKNDFDVDGNNTKTSGESWTKGYVNGDIVCLVGGNNKESAEGAKLVDLIVSCGER